MLTFIDGYSNQPMPDMVITFKGFLLPPQGQKHILGDVLRIGNGAGIVEGYAKYRIYVLFYKAGILLVCDHTGFPLKSFSPIISIRTKFDFKNTNFSENAAGATGGILY